MIYPFLSSQRICEVNIGYKGIDRESANLTRRSKRNAREEDPTQFEPGTNAPSGPSNETNGNDGRNDGNGRNDDDEIHDDEENIDRNPTKGNGEISLRRFGH